MKKKSVKKLNDRAYWLLQTLIKYSRFLESVRRNYWYNSSLEYKIKISFSRKEYSYFLVKELTYSSLRNRIYFSNYRLG